MKLLCWTLLKGLRSPGEIRLLRKLSHLGGTPFVMNLRFTLAMPLTTFLMVRLTDTSNER